MKKNYRKAFPLLLEGARAGYIHAQNLVGYCYSCGLGTYEDNELAVFWFAKAAKQGHNGALYNLALCYEHGRGVEANVRKAFNLYLKAAEAGDRWAQCNLGVVISKVWERSKT